MTRIRWTEFLSISTGYFSLVFKLSNVAALGLIAIGSLFLFFLRSPNLSQNHALLGLAIIWTGLTPGLIHLARPPDERTPFPLMPLVGLFYTVFFGLPVFLTDILRLPETEYFAFYQTELAEISLQALVLTLIGTILMFLSWSASKRFLWYRVPHIRLPDQIPNGRMQVLYWGLAASGLAYTVFPLLRTIPSIGQFLQPAFYLAFAGFYVLWKKNSLPRWQVAGYFLCVLPIWVVVTLAETLLFPTILMIVLWVVLHSRMRERVPWGLIAAFSLIFMIIYPVSGFYRAEIAARSTEVSTGEKIAIIFRSVGHEYFYLHQRPAWHGGKEKIPKHFSSGENLKRFYKGFVTRVSQILPFSHVVEQTPASVPYWGGLTYKPLITSLIPRILWPGKPKETIGNVFGHRYGFLEEGDIRTSVNIPWITELYANFGRSAVTIGMIVFGLFYGLLEKVMNEPGMAGAEWQIGAVILLPLAFPESNFSVMVGSVPPLLICLWLYFMIGMRLRAPPAFVAFWRGVESHLRRN